MSIFPETSKAQAAAAAELQDQRARYLIFKLDRQRREQAEQQRRELIMRNARRVLAEVELKGRGARGSIVYKVWPVPGSKHVRGRK
jgi:hypothetical protein